jgi:hypothetical protein
VSHSVYPKHVPVYRLAHQPTAFLPTNPAGYR